MKPSGIRYLCNISIGWISILVYKQKVDNCLQREKKCLLKSIYQDFLVEKGRKSEFI